MGHATSSCPSSFEVTLLGIPGMRVLAVFEFVDERQVFVETVADRDWCRGWGYGPSLAAVMSWGSGICRLWARRPGWCGTSGSGAVASAPTLTVTGRFRSG